MEEDLPILWIEGARALEGDYMVFTVRLSEPAVDAVTVNFRTLGGTAFEESDVVSWGGDRLTGTLVFAPGEDVKTISVLVANDNGDEIDESVLLEMHDPAGATFGGAQTLTAVGWALDDDGVGANRAIAVSAPVVQEGLGRTAVFTISLSEAFATPQSFAFSTFDGTARAGSDYVARTGTVTFAAGQLETTVEIDLINDAAVEAAESFGLRIDGAGGVTGTVGRAQILNDDGGTPVLSIDGARNLEGEYMAFTVRLSEAATDVVTVQYRTLNGSALVESEVVSWSSNRLVGTLTFAPGEQVKTVYALVSNDNADEIDENVLLEIHDPSGATLAGGAQTLTAVGWALDDDGVGLNRALAVSAPYVVEGAGNDAVFTVSLSEAFATPRSFTYSTFDGTAVAGEDYLARTGTVTFAAGQTEAVVAVDLLNDAAVEDAETFGLRINGANNVGGAVGTAHILNDDGRRPVISVEGAGQREGDYIAFTVRLSAAAADAVTVDYRTLSGTATVESDVRSWSSNRLAGTLTFAPGEQVKTLYALVSNDAEDEIDENVLLQLSNPSRALFAEGARSVTAIGWALDDDGVGVNRSVAVSNPVVSEGNQAVFTVELSQASTTPVTLGYQTSSGSARAGADFLSQSGALTFAAGQTRAYVTVDLLSDRVRETSETFNLAITSYPSQISIRSGDVSGLATIVDGTIRGTSGANTLSGTEAIDRIEGLAGDDVLRGYGGDDRMAGGRDDDTYIVSERGDTVEEARGEGVDTVRSNVSWSLGANVENLILSGRGDIDGTGNGLANRITGNAGDNTLSGASGRDLLYGEAGADRLIGGTGNDLLDGGSGSDRMSGGTGDDVYLVDRSGDVLYEARDAGTDTVRSGTHWTLGANFENLALTGRRDIDGTGNGLANRIVGNSGDNVLSGGAGADRFVFLSDADTGLGRWRDVITDFAPRTDKLVLSAIDANEIRSGNQAFDFIGRADFSRTAGELRFSSDVLSADTDGDGRSDFQIELAGLSRIYSADVIA